MGILRKYLLKGQFPFGDYMKEKLLLFIMLLIIFEVMGCGKNGNTDLGDACIGVIETNGYSEKSRLLIYDENLTEISEVPIKYASVGNIFYNPIVYNNELYIIPQGLANKKDEQKVLKINLSSLDEDIYNIEQLAMNSICTDKGYIYTCNTLNGDSYINKCSKIDQSVNVQIVKQTYISKIVCNDDILYAFGTVKEEKTLKSYIYVFDENLYLIEQIDITEYGSSHYKVIVQDGKIFFSNSLDYKDSPCNTVGVYSTSDKTISTIQLEQNYPLDLVFYNNVLIVSHYDLVRREGGSISLYDLDTKEIRNYQLDHGVEQMTINKDNIYILSEKIIYKYKIKELSLEFKNMIKILTLSDSSYCSGVFPYEIDQ